MTVKCNGAQFLGFYNDNGWWFREKDGTKENPVKSTYWEDAEITVNGKTVPEYEFDFDKDLKATDLVTVRGGVVFGNVIGTKEPSVEGYLKRWLKAQSATTIIVDCPNDKMNTIIEAVKAAGGSILK